jgi:hypothetical protein
MKKTTANNREYFAATEDPIILANGMREKIRVWREWCESNGFTSLWEKKLRNYYGSSASGNSSQRVNAGGTEGELALIKVNDLHSLLQEQLVVVTSQRPAGQAKAINPSTKSLKAARLGTAIAEYYMSEVGFETAFVQVAETCLLCDEGFLDLFWDKSAGDPIAVDPETGIPEMSGDAVLRTHSPWNVSRDPGMKVKDQKWHILSYKVNKFDEAAKYPRFADQILACGEGTDDLPEIPMDIIPDGSDSIWEHLLIHDRTASVKNGRYTILIGDQVVLDSELPYKDYPLERMAPSDVIDGPTGYANANDILALEEVTDALHSITVTNQVTFGGQCLVGPEGVDINHTNLAKGVRFFQLPADMVDKLKPLDLVHTPAEIFNYIGLLGNKKERAVGSVQSALAQQASLGASGNSMALIQTQAISYNSGTQRAYFRVMSSTMTKLIGILRTFADTPRVASIVGKAKAPWLKEFKYTGEDINSISSIVYEMVNPMSQTYGGRLTMAQDLLKAGQIKSPKQYINLVATGQIEVITQDDEADGMLILEENEAQIEGRPVQAIITENHADHIKSHNSLITQDAKEKDPDLVGRVLNHVQEHLNVWQQASATNPGILLVTGQQPLPPPPPQAPLPGGPPSSSPAGALPPPQGIGKLMGGGAPPAQVKAGEIKEPALPNVAGTKEKPPIPGVTDAGVA